MIGDKLETFKFSKTQAQLWLEGYPILTLTYTIENAQYVYDVHIHDGKSTRSEIIQLMDRMWRLVNA